MNNDLEELSQYILVRKIKSPLLPSILLKGGN